MENSRPQIRKFYSSNSKPVVSFEDDCSIDLDKDFQEDNSDIEENEGDNIFELDIPKENAIPHLNIPFSPSISNSKLTEKNTKQNCFLTKATKDTETNGQKQSSSNTLTNLNSKMNSINNIFKDNNIFFSSLKSDDENDDDFVVENENDDDIEMYEEKYRRIKEKSIVPFKCSIKLNEINKFKNDFQNNFVNHDNNISYSNSSESSISQIKKSKSKNSQSSNFRLNGNSKESSNKENKRYIFCKVNDYNTKNNSNKNLNENNKVEVNNNNYINPNTESKNINSISINSLNEKEIKSHKRRKTILNLTKTNKIFQKFLCLGIDTSFLHTLDEDLKVLSLNPKITYNYPYNNLEKELE